MLKRFMPLLVAACVGAGAYHAITHQVLHTNGWQRYLEPELINQLVDRDKACNGLVTFGPTAIGTNKTSCELFTKLSQEQTGVVQLAESPKPPTVLAALWVQSQHPSQLVADGSKPEPIELAVDNTGGSDCELTAKGLHRRYVANFNRYRQLVCRSARDNGLDPTILAAQIYQESKFNPKARSPKNAMGIAQMIRSTANAWGVKDPYNPQEAVPVMAKQLARDIKTFERQGYSRTTAKRLVRAKYNGGPKAVKYFLARGLKFIPNRKAKPHSYASETAPYVLDCEKHEKMFSSDV